MRVPNYISTLKSTDRRKRRNLRWGVRGSSDRGHEDFFSAALRRLRASMSCLVIRVPRRASQCRKNGCEKFDFVPIVCG